MKKYIVLLLQLLLTCSLLAPALITTAQPYFFRHYQVENGLSNNTVYCSLQDANGFLWFGTKDGLNRFDGYHFKQFNINDDGHTHGPDMINCLLSDNQNVLWVGCQEGLYWFDANKEILVPVLNNLKDILSLQIDKAGRIWFISEIGRAHV